MIVHTKGRRINASSFTCIQRRGIGQVQEIVPRHIVTAQGQWCANFDTDSMSHTPASKCLHPKTLLCTENNIKKQLDLSKLEKLNSKSGVRCNKKKFCKTKSKVSRRIHSRGGGAASFRDHIQHDGGSPAFEHLTSQRRTQHYTTGRRTFTDTYQVLHDTSRSLPLILPRPRRPIVRFMSHEHYASGAKVVGRRWELHLDKASNINILFL